MNIKNIIVIPQLDRDCHSDLFGIILKKDAGQASMTETGKDTGQAGMTN